jgi:hypothetical protein
MSILKVAALQNTAGVGIYTAKAWVNLNGTGTIAIRASGNTSSLTDIGVGTYYMNFAVTQPNANYSYAHSYSNEVNVQHAIGVLASISTGTVGVSHYNGANTANTVDKSYVLISIYNN